MSQDQLYYLGIKAIIQNNAGQILIIKNSKGYWEFPGGRIQHNEQVLDALLREVKEETGLTALEDITPDAMVLTPFRVLSSGLIQWYHTCTLKTAEPLILSDECIDYLWVDADLAKNMTLIDDSVAPHIFKKG